MTATPTDQPDADADDVHYRLSGSVTTLCSEDGYSDDISTSEEAGTGTCPACRAAADEEPPAKAAAPADQPDTDGSYVPDVDDRYMHCPFCPHTEWVSPDDPDASFGQMLGHVQSRHTGEDQTPAVLWPKIEVK